MDLNGMRRQPAEWQTKRLDEITNTQKPISYGIVQTGKPIHNGVKCIRVVDIKNGRINPEDLITTSEEISTAYKRTILSTGDLVIALRGKIGELALIEPALAGSNLTRGVALISPTDEVDSEYLLHYLSSAESRRVFEKNLNGSALQEIPIAALRAITAAIPNKVEQRGIASVLSDMDALLAKLDQLIAKKRDIKQAAMQELLTGRWRLPGFSAPWAPVKIGTFTECTSGGTPNTEKNAYWGGHIPWMNSGELNLKRVHDVEGRITEEGLKNSSTKTIPPGCVLIGLAGQGRTRGTAAINTISLTTNQSIAAIHPSQKHISEYLYHNLDFRYEELRAMSTGDGGRGGLNLGIIRNAVVPLPEISEQTAIATMLNDIDTEITALEARREKTLRLKQGMMQELLSGRIRLI